VQSKALYGRKSETNPKDTNNKNGEVNEENDGANVWWELSESEGEKRTLSYDEVLELSDLVMKIEKHYGFPVDVEWALLRSASSEGQARENGGFYIVQSRPITTL
jgi:pyruvate,water dikinase